MIEPSISEAATAVNNATLEMLVSPVMTQAVPVVFIVVFVCSTPFNLMSLVALLSIHYKRHTPTSVFAVNLTLADLLYSIFLPLQVVYHFQGNDWQWGASLCGATTTLLHCNMHCSVLTTSAIALERYCGVVRPLRTKHWRTPRRAAVACVGIWVTVLVTQIPLIKSDLTLRIVELNITSCFDVVPRRLFPYKSFAYLYFVTIMILFYLIPLIILISCYVAVAKTLRKSTALNKGQGKDLALQRAQTVVGLATACFIVCYLPTITLQVIHFVLSSKNSSMYAYYKLAVAFNSLNCCFDPFVYYFSSGEFRQTLRKALGKWCGRCALLTESDESGTSELATVNKDVYREIKT